MKLQFVTQCLNLIHKFREQFNEIIHEDGYTTQRLRVTVFDIKQKVKFVDSCKLKIQQEFLLNSFVPAGRASPALSLRHTDATSPKT